MQFDTDIEYNYSGCKQCCQYRLLRNEIIISYSTKLLDTHNLEHLISHIFLAEPNYFVAMAQV